MTWSFGRNSITIIGKTNKREETRRRNMENQAQKKPQSDHSILSRPLPEILDEISLAAADANRFYRAHFRALQALGTVF